MDGRNYWTQLADAAHFAIVLMNKDKNITIDTAHSWAGQAT